MRRTDREITDREKINKIIEACHCCRLGFCDEGKVYIVSLNFGYEDEGSRRVFYFHGAMEGRKIDLIQRTHCAGFELDTNYQLQEADMACGYSAKYQSVIGTGRVDLIEDPEAKKQALLCIMRHQSGREDWTFSEASLDKVAVFQLEVEEISCKEHK